MNTLGGLDDAIPIQHNGHCVIQHTLAKHIRIQITVHSQCGEDGQDSDRIRGLGLAASNTR